MVLKSRLKMMKTFMLSLTMAIFLPLGVHAQTDFSFSSITSEQLEYEAEKDGEYILSDYADELVGWSGTNIDTRAESEARSKIHEALKQHSDAIDVRSYRLTVSEAYDLLEDVIYWDGTLFYVNYAETRVEWINGGIDDGVVTCIYPSYIEHEEEVEKALKKAIQESITLDMSDLQKMLALHDWLATHCSYDYSLERYSVYDALVGGSAVCQGYKDAYEMLLRYVGILEVGTASGGNHTWNQVKIDEQWYNVDVTWDSNAIEGRPLGQMYYGNFIGSDIKFKLGGHTFESQDHECTSTLYDEDAWWDAGGEKVYSPVMPINGTGSYRLKYDGSNMSLIFRAETTGAEKVVHVFNNAIWGYSSGNQSFYYTDCFGVLQHTDGATFVNDAKNVYRITDDGNISTIYTYDVTDGRNIFGIQVQNGKLKVQIGFEPVVSKSEIKTISLEPYIAPSDDVVSFVERLYIVCLGRKYDEKGLSDWVEQLESQTKSAAEVAQGFFFSDEFKEKKYSDQEYLNILYQTMFDRDGDEAGMEDWLGQLENGVSRLYVYRGFAESKEFTQLCDKYNVIRGSVDVTEWRDRNPGATGFIARLYTKMLGRKFDEDGLEDWCRAYLTGERTIEQIATEGFLHSRELLEKNLSDEEFVSRMYQTFLNRQPDPQGLSDWVERLRSGRENRDTLVYGFTQSGEFSELKASYGL